MFTSLDGLVYGVDCQCVSVCFSKHVGSNHLHSNAAFSSDQNTFFSKSSVAHSVVRAADVHMLHYNANV